MSFATALRNRNSERVIALISAVAVVLSMMVMFASPAQAHHPELTASQACVDGAITVSWTSASWLTTGASGSGHSDIRIQMSVGGGSWQEIASGAYTAGNNYRFSGSFDGSGYWQQSISLRAYADGPWDNGSAGGQYSSVTQLTINQDCFNPSCPDGYEQYKIDQKPSNGTYGNFTISNFVSGANGETFDWSSSVPVFQVIVKGGPSANVYNYSGATSDSGLHSPTNPNNGKYFGVSHVTFCWDDTPPPPPDGWVCDEGDVVYMEDVSNYVGNVYETEEEAAADPDCAPPPPPSGWVCDDGEVSFMEDATGYEGALYETEEEAAADPDCAPPPPPSGWVCEDGQVSFMEDATGYQGALYETEEEAAADPDCAPPPPPSGYACVNGEVVFIEDATDFEGTLYETAAEAADDADCIEVAASTTFTITGTCAAVDDVAGFTISGNLGEGVTLQVAGQTLTATGAFSVDVGAAGSYPYTITLDDGFVLAEGSPDASATIVIEDCTPTITIETLGVCVNDAPWLYYSVSVSGDVAPGSDTVDIRWFSAGGVEGTDPAHNYLGLPLTGNLTGSTLNADGSVAETITNANRVPWVGLRLASDGVTPVDWPGWVFQGGEWLQQDDGFAWARQPGAFVELTVNPTGTDVLAYPPSTPTCSANPPDEVENEVIDTVDEVDELPLTGLETDTVAIVGATLLIAGASILVLYGKREES